VFASKESDSSMQKTILAFLILAGSVGADHHFIAPNGSDQNIGSLAAPWATFRSSLRQVSPGDTLLVRGGYYNEGEIWIRSDLGMGGKDGKFVTVMAFPGETPELDGERRMIVEASYIRIQGLTFLNTYSLDLPYWGEPGTREYVEILDNRFVGAFIIPLEFCGNHGLIEGNRFENTNGESHAIYLHYGHHNIIRNNQILGTNKYGIHVYDEHRQEDPPGFVRKYANILLENNLIANSRSRSGIILGTSADAPTPGVLMDSLIIRFNTIIHNAGAGVLIKAWAGEIKNVDIFHNTLFDNRSGGIVLENCQNVRIHNNIIVSELGSHISKDNLCQNIQVSYNLFWPLPLRLGSIAPNSVVLLDPQFVDSNHDRFQLQATSPAIDAGMEVGLPFSGLAPDLGAWQYESTVPVLIGSFQASVQRDSVVLQWTIGSNDAIYGFAIERSDDDQNYRKIGYIPAANPQSTYRYVDRSIKTDLIFYRLRILNRDGSVSFSESLKISLQLPAEFGLKQNYPNPFNPSTQIDYYLEKPQHVSIVVLNPIGQQIAALVEETRPAGQNSVTWTGVDENGKKMATGVYFYQFSCESFHETKKMILLY